MFGGFIASKHIEWREDIMDKSINFMEFVTQNQPPCVPGTKLYWFDEETGELRLDDRGIESIVLDSDWKWKIIDPDNGEIVEPNTNQYFCITKEDAKKFRDAIGEVKYAIFEHDPNGDITFEDENYTYVKLKSFNACDVDIDQCYIDYVVDTDEEVQPGMAVWFGRSAYQILENGVRTGGCIKAKTKETKRVLEDAFEE